MGYLSVSGVMGVLQKQKCRRRIAYICLRVDVSEHDNEQAGIIKCGEFLE